VEKRYQSEIKAFGKHLHKLQEERSHSQLDLEVQSGINRTEISRIENGRKNIEFMTIVRLAASPDINIDEFFVKQ
jgi:transcriptional regulator with XRE-family HTH domain